MRKIEIRQDLYVVIAFDGAWPYVVYAGDDGEEAIRAARQASPYGYDVRSGQFNIRVDRVQADAMNPRGTYTAPVYSRLKPKKGAAVEEFFWSGELAEQFGMTVSTHHQNPSRPVEPEPTKTVH